jgi:protein-disulfide isomerase
MSQDHKPNQNQRKKSQQNRQQTARDRMRAERQRAQEADSRRRKIVVTAGIAGVLLLVGGIAVAVSTADSSSGSAASGALVVPEHATGTDGTVITYGKASAANTLDVYEDFRCPVCAKLEKADGEVIRKLADDGTYKIQYHMASFLDANLGGKGSKAALAATGAALNEGVDKFKKFHDVLYANQPAEEQNDSFGDVNHLLDLAGQVPGLKTPAFVKAVKDGTYAPWVSKVSAAFDRSGVTGTPTLKLNGQTLNLFGSTGTPVTADQYTELVRQAVAATKK